MVVIPVTAIIAATGRAGVEGKLKAAGAVTPERAIMFTPEGSTEVSGLDEAIGLGRVVRTTSGKLYLNPAATGSGTGEVMLALLLFLLVTASMLASVIALIAAFKD